MIVCSFDTETTGLIENHARRINLQPEVIEIYACTFDPKNGKIKKEIDQLVQPTITKELSEETKSITSISTEQLSDKPRFKEVYPSIKAFIEKADVITAHNLAFDMEILDIEAERINLPRINWPKRKVCTVEQTVHLRGIRLSLSELHEFLFQEQFSGAHRAKVDVLAQVRCYVELVKRGEI